MLPRPCSEQCYSSPALQPRSWVHHRLEPGLPSTVTWWNRVERRFDLRSGLVVSLAAKYHLPAIYAFAYFPTSGGLVSYGIDPFDSFRRAPAYVDAILRGTKPQDLPVQFPTKFELVINLKTAKTLGLDVASAARHC